MSFTNLIRFKDKKGNILYGDVSEAALDNIIGSTVQVLNGDSLQGELEATNSTAVVHEVGILGLHSSARSLPPLTAEYSWNTASGSHRSRPSLSLHRAELCGARQRDQGKRQRTLTKLIFHSFTSTNQARGSSQPRCLHQTCRS